MCMFCEIWDYQIRAAEEYSLPGYVNWYIGSQRFPWRWRGKLFRKFVPICQSTQCHTWKTGILICDSLLYIPVFTGQACCPVCSDLFWWMRFELKIQVFWYIIPCRLIMVTDVSEKRIASIVRAKQSRKSKILGSCAWNTPRPVFLSVLSLSLALQTETIGYLFLPSQKHHCTELDSK
jgi:hypothetical protein